MASTKYKIRNVSRAQDKTCNRRIKNEKQEHKTKTMQQKDEKRKKPSASLYTCVVKPNQLEEEKPLEKVI